MLLVEQHKRIGDAFDGIDQVPVGRFRPQPRLAQQVIAGLEFGHGLVQRIGALANLLGEHHRVLERRIRVIAPGYAGLHPFDQRLVDAPQLAIFMLQGSELGLQLNDGRGRDVGQWQLR